LKITRMLVDIHGAKEEALKPIISNLHRLRRPTLIVWGAKDRVFPLQQAYSAKRKMPNAQLHIMKECGHIPNLERPEEFNNLVINFLINNRILQR
ncbi:MAG: alpha/beta fold hydrolase, partial [Syntrophales bacterium LBB04]|nr:alpha/beta fold hydrolase [Syntrophales bacterium LBB04]